MNDELIVAALDGELLADLARDGGDRRRGDRDQRELAARSGAIRLDEHVPREMAQHLDALLHVLLVELRIGGARVRLLRVLGDLRRVALQIADRLVVLELALVGLPDVLEEQVVRQRAVRQDELAHGARVVALQIQLLAAVVALAAELQQRLLRHRRQRRAVVDIEPLRRVADIPLVGARGRRDENESQSESEPPPHGRWTVPLPSSG